MNGKGPPRALVVDRLEARALQVVDRGHAAHPAKTHLPEDADPLAGLDEHAGVAAKREGGRLVVEVGGVAATGWPQAPRG